MRALTFFIVIFTFFGCRKDEIMSFTGRDAMSLYVNNYEADSLIYSFSYSLPSVSQDTVFLKLRLQGRPSEQDRTVSLMAKDSTDAQEGIDFILPEAVLPAGEVEILYPVVLLRSDNLKKETKSLYVTVKPNDFFELGALGQEVGGSYSIPRYVIRFNDFLSKPAYWDSMQSILGVFSVVKLQFMFSVYEGVTDFSTLSTAETLNLRLRLRSALADYEAANGPLLDENGIRVTF